MTLTERAVSLFGEIAVASGVFEAQHGAKPRYAVLSTSDAATIREYLKQSDEAAGYTAGPLARTTRNVAKRALVSGLEVKVWTIAGRLHVC